MSRTGPARAPESGRARSARSKTHRMAVAAPALVAGTLLIPTTAAQATPEGCVPGFSEPGAVNLQEYLAAPRHLAGLEAGLYWAPSLTDRFDVIDEDDDGLVCLKAVSNLQGNSDRNWGFFYLADDG
jgi:hypothetical protein